MRPHQFETETGEKGPEKVGGPAREDGAPRRTVRRQQSEGARQGTVQGGEP